MALVLVSWSIPCTCDGQIEGFLKWCVLLIEYIAHDHLWLCRTRHENLMLSLCDFTISLNLYDKAANLTFPTFLWHHNSCGVFLFFSLVVLFLVVFPCMNFLWCILCFSQKMKIPSGLLSCSGLSCSCLRTGSYQQGCHETVWWSCWWLDGSTQREECLCDTSWKLGTKWSCLYPLPVFSVDWNLQYQLTSFKWVWEEIQIVFILSGWEIHLAGRKLIWNVIEIECFH